MVRRTRFAGLRLCALYGLVLAIFASSHTSFAQSAGQGGSAPFRVYLLGTGSPLYEQERVGPAILVEAGQQKLLFDVGRGATQRLFEAGLAFGDIDKVFLTHLHSDHTLGVAPLWLDGWLRGRTAPLRIWGPPGTEKFAQGLRDAFADDISLRLLKNDGSKLQVQEVAAAGVIHRQDGVTVEAIEVDHGPVKPAYGFRIDYNGKSVVLSGDTKYSRNLVDRARGTDVFVHEVAAASPQRAATPFVKSILNIHTLPEEVGKAFAEAKPKLGLYSHIVQFGIGDAELTAQTRTTYDGPLVVGHDGMVVDIGEQVVVRRSAAAVPK